MIDRVLVLLLVVAAGCHAGVRPPAAGSPEITAELAVEGAKAVVRARRTVTPPAPSVPAGVCPRCLGKGYVGDEAGIRIQCDACKGTGKTAAAKSSLPCTSGTCGVRR